MKIEVIEIQNFRKLKKARIEFSDEETIFVGANNSGKTSAMEAIDLFLSADAANKLSHRDFTLSNWEGINKLAQPELSTREAKQEWHKLIPTLDIWIDVPEHEVYLVTDLIPTLDWQVGRIGVRFCYEPKKLDTLFSDYHSSLEKIKKHKDKGLWPVSFEDFLRKNSVLHNHFELKMYLLDPSKQKKDLDPQILPELSDSINTSILTNLIKVDFVTAQRGLIDAHSKDKDLKGGRLSQQVKRYYSRHINPENNATDNSLEALVAIKESEQKFNGELEDGFQERFSELEKLNYPGLHNPRLIIGTKVDPGKSLEHEAAVQYSLNDKVNENLLLPEHYNGLGYQNLISMAFMLMDFRDSRLASGNRLGRVIPPIHLVLLEEPEAHLHIQMQQVFISNALKILKNHSKSHLMTQLIVSTHSSHIANEKGLKFLRYFKRNIKQNKTEVDTAIVVNLSDTFGTEIQTEKFAERYLKITHSDLFFADGIILVEGSTEKILLPSFISAKFPDLSNCYITTLEIGGSHAFKLRPLLEKLMIPTLVITDIDSYCPKQKSRVTPDLNQEYITSNSTLKKWIPGKEKIDCLIEMTSAEKIYDSFARVAYQSMIEVSYNGKNETVFPSTFEDALIWENFEFIRDNDWNGNKNLKKIQNILNEGEIQQVQKKIYENIRKISKVEMAVEIIFSQNSDKISLLPPKYIAEGLQWLQAILIKKTNDEH